MISEWLQVMLDEIARKKAEAEQARLEELRRAAASGYDQKGAIHGPE